MRVGKPYIKIQIVPKYHIGLLAIDITNLNNFHMDLKIGFELGSWVHIFRNYPIKAVFLNRAYQVDPLGHCFCSSIRVIKCITSKLIISREIALSDLRLCKLI